MDRLHVRGRLRMVGPGLDLGPVLLTWTIDDRAGQSFAVLSLALVSLEVDGLG